MATVKQLSTAAEDLNSLYEKPVIKITSESTAKQLTAAIEKCAEELSEKDSLLQSTVDVLTELEIDIPAKLKIRKPAKEKTAAKVKSTATKSKSEKKPGVIQRVFELVCEKGPITADKLLTILSKEFPDRKPDSMMATIKIQLPGRMARERGVKIIASDKGFEVKK